jgi:hypothetical protein
MAPQPTLSCSSVPNRVLSVVLRERENVRWIWTTGPDGEYVSGYTILTNRLPRKARRTGPSRRGSGVDSFSSADITGVTGLFTMDPREVQA